MNDSPTYAGEPAGIGVLIRSLPAWSRCAVVIGMIGFFFVKYLMPKMTELLDERAAKIDGGLELAKKAPEEAAAAKSEKEAELAAARREAASIREEATN